MTRKIICLFSVYILLGAFVFTICDAFYSTSWGNPRSYDPANIDLNADNMDYWLSIAVGNPELAKALAEKLKDLVQGMPDTAEKAKLQNAGIQLAIEASGLGTTFLGNIDKVSDLLGDGSVAEREDILLDLIGSFINDVDRSATSDLAEIVQPANPPGFGNPPHFSAAFKDETSASDVGKAVVLLLVTMVGDMSNSEHMENALKGEFGFRVEPGKAVFYVDPISDHDDYIKAQTLGAYLNLITEDPPNGKFSKNPITKSIKEMISSWF